MCEPPDSHIPHTRPCPETFSGLPRLERLQLCEEVGLGSPSNTKWEPSPPSPHQDRFCLPEDFSKLRCIGQDWSFGICLSIIWTFIFQILVSGLWRRPPPPWGPPSLGPTPPFLVEWPSSWPSRESAGPLPPPTCLLRILRRRTRDMTPTSHRQPRRLGPRPRGSTTQNPGTGEGVLAPATVLTGPRRTTKHIVVPNRKTTSQPRLPSCELSSQKSNRCQCIPPPLCLLFI